MKKRTQGTNSSSFLPFPFLFFAAPFPSISYTHTHTQPTHTLFHSHLFLLTLTHPLTHSLSQSCRPSSVLSSEVNTHPLYKLSYRYTNQGRDTLLSTGLQQTRQSNSSIRPLPGPGSVLRIFLSLASNKRTATAKPAQETGNTHSTYPRPPSYPTRPYAIAPKTHSPLSLTVSRHYDHHLFPIIYNGQHHLGNREATLPRSIDQKKKNTNSYFFMFFCLLVSPVPCCYCCCCCN